MLKQKSATMSEDARSMLSIGQASLAGPKERNDDFYGATLPCGSALITKGTLLAIADGISSSRYGQIAAQAAIKSLMNDYYATPDAWSVKTSISRVIDATNNWLHAQASFKGICDPDQGYVCTLAAIVFKGQFAHIFNIGDSRIWRLSGSSLEPITREHISLTPDGQKLLSRALGVEDAIEIDYRKETLSAGDIYLFTTDGLHDFWDQTKVAGQIHAASDLDEVACQIVEDALKRGSDDNITLQIARINQLPDSDQLPFATDQELMLFRERPKPGDVIDGITILREIHSNHRSHIFLGSMELGQKVAFKIPASDILNDTAAMRRFMIEEWVAKRLDNAHLLSAPSQNSPRSGLYILTDYVEGQTLRQWMHDNPERSLEQCRTILEQIIKGLRVFHRREMLHQDLRPENIIIAADMTVTIIDFGLVYVAGVQEAGPIDEGAEIMGTVQYTAPEYYTNEPISWQSDLFSLGVIAYELLTDALPYGIQVSHLRKPSDRKHLRYRPAHNNKRAIPDWLDHTLRLSVHPTASQRFAALSEFEVALRSPSITYRAKSARPLFERATEGVWKGLGLLLSLICLTQAIYIFTHMQ